MRGSPSRKQRACPESGAALSFCLLYAFLGVYALTSCLWVGASPCRRIFEPILISLRHSKLTAGGGGGAATRRRTATLSSRSGARGTPGGPGSAPSGVRGEELVLRVSVAQRQLGRGRAQGQLPCRRHASLYQPPSFHPIAPPLLLLCLFIMMLRFHPVFL